MKIDKNKVIDTILANMSPKYRLVYAAVMGSHLYGTSSPDSDLDVKFVFMPSVDDCILGIDSKNLNMNTNGDNTKNTKDDVDLQGWSLQYFVNLLWKGDTNALDLLFSNTNPDAVIFDDNTLVPIFSQPQRFFDASKLRGLLGYVVTQSERYGLKGSRFQQFLKVKAIIDECVARYTEDEYPNLKLKDIYEEILDKVQDDLYCKFEKTDDDRPAIRLCGKVHLIDIALYEFVRRIGNEMDRYGDRAKQSLDGSDWKALSHAYRGILESEDLLSMGRIKFPLTKADVLLKIKQGLIPRHEVDAMVSDGMASLTEKLKNVDSKKVDTKFTARTVLDLYQQTGMLLCDVHDISFENAINS